ncbi:hypothetical protein B0H14DRAFT_2658000 [Mycena olivaceomarginata]|nr:hypothetical protein B0H14DRAFT_2658000 [Mycena olivaceomarginata]
MQLKGFLGRWLAGNPTNITLKSYHDYRQALTKGCIPGVHDELPKANPYTHCWLPLHLWLDKGLVTNHVKMFPIVLHTLWLPLEIHNASGNGGGVLLGFMVMVNDPGNTDDRTDKQNYEFAQFKRELYQLVFEIIFEPLSIRSWNGEATTTCGDGVTRVFSSTRVASMANYFPPYYRNPYGYNWPTQTHGQIPPPMVQPQQFSFIAYDPAASDASRADALPPAARVPLAPIQEAAQNTSRITALAPESQPESRPHRSSGKPFTAKELFDILQTAIMVQFYTAKHREKGAKLKEFGNAVRALNIQGSDDVFKARIKDLLAYHEAPESAPPAVRNAIEGSSHEGTFGAPLDMLMAQKRLYEDKTDAQKEKLRKARFSNHFHCLPYVNSLQKADEDKQGGEAIRNASLNRSRRRAALETESDDSDDEVVITSHRMAEPANVDTLSVTAAPVLEPSTLAKAADFLPALETQEPPVSPLAKNPIDSDSDSDVVEVVSNAIPPSTPVPVRVKAEHDGSSLPSKKLKGRDNKSTPLPSIPRANGKSTAKKGASSSKKRPSADGSDAENSPAPSTRNTKRLRKSGSFDIEGFMTEECQHRQEFQDKMLKHMAQGNIEFRKASEQTRTFQDDFLGFLRGGVSQELSFYSLTIVI